MTKNRWYWIAFMSSTIFGVLTFFTATEPREYLGVLSSIALCIICAIKILTEDDDEFEDNEDGEV